MALPTIYTKTTAEDVIGRINKLNASTTGQWGKMDVAQMMAHCNITFEMAFDPTYKKSPGILRFILKNLVKGNVVGEKPYKKNDSTPPQMLVKTEKNFTDEKQRLISYLQNCVHVGEQYFEGLDHPAFGKMTKIEWSNLLYKHLNHHLTQFGV